MFSFSTQPLLGLTGDRIACAEGAHKHESMRTSLYFLQVVNVILFVSVKINSLKQAFAHHKPLNSLATNATFMEKINK